MTKFLETRFGKVALADSGEGAASILFIHGNSTSKCVFTRQFESSLSECYRLVAFDLPGHGESDNAENPLDVYTIRSYAQLVGDLAETLKLQPLVLVGWSLGGHVAIEVAAQGLSVVGIVLSGTPPVGPGIEHMAKAFKPSETMELTGKSSFEGQDAAEYARAVMGSTNDVTKEILQAVARTDGIARQVMLEDWSRPEAGHNQREFVREWQNPIAVLQGEQDAFVSAEYLRTLNWNNLWHNQIDFIKGIGHAPFWQDAPQFNRLLVSFLKDIEF